RCSARSAPPRLHWAHHPGGRTGTTSRCDAPANPASASGPPSTHRKNRQNSLPGAARPLTQNAAQDSPNCPPSPREDPFPLLPASVRGPHTQPSPADQEFLPRSEPKVNLPNSPPSSALAQPQLFPIAAVHGASEVSPNHVPSPPSPGAGWELLLRANQPVRSWSLQLCRRIARTQPQPERNTKRRRARPWLSPELQTSGLACWLWLSDG